MRIQKIILSPLNLKMHSSFVTALGKKTVSRNLLVAVRLENGVTGIGEASASLAWPLDTQETMARSIRSLEGKLTGQDILSCSKLIHSVWENIGKHPTAAAALECALFDAWAQNAGTTLWKFFGAKLKKVETSFTISAWPAEEALHAAKQRYKEGFKRLKIKITGKNLDEDLKRIFKISRALPKAGLMIDANQGFETEEAVRFFKVLKMCRVPILLIEQPVAKENTEGLKKIESEMNIPVAADESARSVEEAKKLIRRKTVSVINIKLAKCGLLGAFEIIQCARKHAAKLMIGCMAESALGLTPSVHLACGTGAFEFVDLDSHLLSQAPKQKPGFTTKGPVLTIR